MGFFLRALATAIAIFIVALVLPDRIEWGAVDYGMGEAGRYLSLLVTGLVLGLLNGFVRPILMMISMPLTCLTLGLFAFVINALMLYIVSAIPQTGFSIVGFSVNGFTLDGLLWAVIASILISLISGLVSKVVH
jgi:putative membrane protein